MIPKKFDFQKVQKELQRLNLDGWLAIDFKGRNLVALQVLGFPPNAHISRRWFYWIPKSGTPYKLQHVIEEGLLDHLEGTLESFISYDDFASHLKNILYSSSKIALEYSPMGAIPSLSFVDGGTLELIRSFNVEVVSSQEILQNHLSLLTPQEIESQKRASVIALKTMEEAWEWIGAHLKEGITESDVQTFILKRFHEQGCVTDWMPIVATNEHSALPHYSPPKFGSAKLKSGDFILIDHGCKEPNGIYSDITRVACIQREPNEEEQKVFKIIREAQQIGFEMVKHPCTGAEVDRAARAYIAKNGYGAAFTHRLGHNITQEAHGPGAHLDSLETIDHRPLLENTCFSIEPGIYLKGQFGIRLESTVLLLPGREVLITGGTQEEIFTIN